MYYLTMDEIAGQAKVARVFLERYSTVLEPGSQADASLFRNRNLFEAVQKDVPDCLPCCFLNMPLEEVLANVKSPDAREFFIGYYNVRRGFSPQSYSDCNDFVAERIVESGAEVVIDLFPIDGETIKEYMSRVESKGKEISVVGIDSCVHNVTQAVRRNIPNAVFLPYGINSNLELIDPCQHFLDGKCEHHLDPAKYKYHLDRRYAQMYLFREHYDLTPFLVAEGSCGDITDIAVEYAIRFPVKALFIGSSCFEKADPTFKIPTLKNIRLAEGMRHFLGHEYERRLEADDNLGGIFALLFNIGSEGVHVTRDKANPLCSNLYFRDALMLMMALERAHRLAEFGYNVSVDIEGGIFGRRN